MQANLVALPRSVALRTGLPMRHIAQGGNVPMYITDRQGEPAGDFAGPLDAAHLAVEHRRITESPRPAGHRTDLAAPAIAITHEPPGHMFITDLPADRESR